MRANAPPIIFGAIIAAPTYNASKKPIDNTDIRPISAKTFNQLPRSYYKSQPRIIIVLFDLDGYNRKR